ncbi:MAG: flippase-like domain-containing protein [Magnetococcales bacterium]|nr:flippase-like domain-containing protein [Magnetococcales bacterium]
MANLLKQRLMRFKEWPRLHPRRFAVIKLFVLLVVVVLAYLSLEFNSDDLTRLSSHWLIAALVMAILWQWIQAVRWDYCLHCLAPDQPRASLLRLGAILLVGNLVSLSLLPSVIGQTSVKLVKWRSVSNRLKVVTQSVIMTLIAGMASVICLGLFGLYGLVLIETHSQSQLVGLMPYSSLITLLAIAAVVGLVLHQRVIIWLLALLKRMGMDGRLTTVREVVCHIRWPLLLQAIAGQLLFVGMAVCALWAVRDLAVLTSVAITAAAALGRLVPLSILGVSLGEGILSLFLAGLGWSPAEILMGASLPVLLFYLVSLPGLVMELMPQQHVVDFSVDKSVR